MRRGSVLLCGGRETLPLQHSPFFAFFESLARPRFLKNLPVHWLKANKRAKAFGLSPDGSFFFCFQNALMHERAGYDRGICSRRGARGTPKESFPAISRATVRTGSKQKYLP